MDPQTKKEDFEKKLQERFALLPKVVQDAIKSSDIEKHLRELADTHKLHLDQWERLENEVMLALMGFQPIEELRNNIQRNVNVSTEIAGAFAEDISRVVFEPIREELERMLGHPQAKTEVLSDVEAARKQVLANQPTANVASSDELRASSRSTFASDLSGDSSRSPQLVARSSVAPGTPPQPPPTAKTERGPASGAYKPGASSMERKDVHDDPYRESPI